MRDVRVVRAGEAKLCEDVRETIFLSLGLEVASSPPGQGLFFNNFCAQACGFSVLLGRFSGLPDVFLSNFCAQACGF